MEVLFAAKGGKEKEKEKGEGLLLMGATSSKPTNCTVFLVVEVARRTIDRMGAR